MIRTVSSAREIAKPTHHHLGARFISTRLLTSSLSEVRVRSGATTGASGGNSFVSVIAMGLIPRRLRLAIDLRVGIANQGAVAGARPRVQLLEQHEVDRGSLAFGNGAALIIAIAKYDRL